jgi:hypothetical protein
VTIIDFGSSTSYKTSEGGAHVTCISIGDFVGTLAFSSTNSHQYLT